MQVSSTLVASAPFPFFAAACACRSALGSPPRGSLLPPGQAPAFTWANGAGAQGRQIRALWCHVRSFLWAQVRREGADRGCCESAPVLLRPQLGGRVLFTGREPERSSGKTTRAQTMSCFPSKGLSGDGEQPSCSSVPLSAELAGFLPQPPRCRGAAPRPVPRWRWAAVTQGESTRPSAPPLYLPATEAAALDLSRLCQHSQKAELETWHGGAPGLSFTAALARARDGVGTLGPCPLAPEPPCLSAGELGARASPSWLSGPGGAPLVAAAARRGLIRAAAVLSPARPSAAGSGAARRAAEKYARLI